MLNIPRAALLASTLALLGPLVGPAFGQETPSVDTGALVEECRAGAQNVDPNASLQGGEALAPEEPLAPTLDTCSTVLQPEPSPAARLGNPSPDDFTSSITPDGPPAFAPETFSSGR